MSKMRNPFETADDEIEPAPVPLDLSNFAPKRADQPTAREIRDVETVSSSHGFAGIRRPRRRRGPPREPWTIRAPRSLRDSIEAIGERLDIRDDDVIQMLLDSYNSTQR